MKCCRLEAIFDFNQIDDAYGYHVTHSKRFLLARSLMVSLGIKRRWRCVHISVLYKMKMCVSFNGLAPSVRIQSPRHVAVLNREHLDEKFLIMTAFYRSEIRTRQSCRKWSRVEIYSKRITNFIPFSIIFKWWPYCDHWTWNGEKL